MSYTHDSILKFVRDTFETYLAADDSNIKILDSIEAIEHRKEDPRFYLGVVGEFSSGKSAFINGLLGQDILQEDIAPTTACATYISRAEGESSLSVTFDRGYSYEATSRNMNDLTGRLMLRFGQRPKDFSDLVRILTSDNNVARCVASLELRLEGIALPKDVVLIDTPGFNPGEDTLENHREVTENVISNIADAVIVIMSATQGFTASLSNFIAPSLARCKERSIFVISKADLIEPEQMPTLLSNTMDSIDRDFGIPAPSLYPVCAIAERRLNEIINNPDIDEMYLDILAPRYTTLASEFGNVRQELWHSLRASKNAAIQDHLRALITDTLKATSSAVDTARKEADDKYNWLKENAPADIEKVCKNMVNELTPIIDDIFSQLHTSVPEFTTQAQKIIDNIVDALDDADSLSNSSLRDNVFPRVNNRLNSSVKVYIQQQAENIRATYRRCNNKVRPKMQELFTAQFSSLESLVSKENLPTTIPISKQTTKVPDIKVPDIWDDVFNSDNFLDAAATLIEGAVDWIKLRTVEGRREKRNKTRGQMMNNVYRAQHSLNNSIAQYVVNAKREYLKAIKNLAQLHIKTYRNIVDNLSKEHQQQLNNVAVDRKSLENIKNELKDMLKSLS